MASLFLEDLHSSDSEDDDYVPDPGELGSDDNNENPLLPDDEIKTKKKTHKRNALFSVDAENSLEKSTTMKSNVNQKERANDLFKNFLQEIEAEAIVNESSISPRNTDDSPVVLSSDFYIIQNQTLNQNTSEKPQCELFEFAGEAVDVSVKDGVKVAVTTEGSADSNSKKSDKPAEGPSVIKRKGLKSVLDTIMNKKQKLTTLEKSSLDWNSFKQEHGISKELETFNKGRGGYIERQNFLRRSDVKCYEVERDLRLFKGKKSS